MEKITQFDYIIIGAGAAGLMLASALVNDDFFNNTSILLLDRDAKRSNDRTWCFWEKGEGSFESIVSKTWNHIYFGSENFSKDYSITPYQYKMVRGANFYKAYFDGLKGKSNITFQQEEVAEIVDMGSKVKVTTHRSTYSASKVFSSSFDYTMATHQKKYPVLQQHFLGWTVKIEKPVFNPDQATYMDFSIPQKGNTRFMYLLPFSKNEALVEYTLFSKNRLPKEAYENAIIHYLENHLKCGRYSITETEQGSIPMTCYDFSEHHTENIRYIGTAGGWAKPSTGYTFMSTAKKIPVLVDFIKTGKPLNTLSFKNRFWFYDLLFLDVLAKHNDQGHKIFESLFKKSDPQLIFRFLDEKSSFREDIDFILSCPKKIFIEAFFNRIFKRFRSPKPK